MRGVDPAFASLAAPGHSTASPPGTLRRGADGGRKGRRKRFTEGHMALAEGKKAPGFALPDETGKTVKIADLGGRRVVLFFFPRAGTSG